MNFRKLPEKYENPIDNVLINIAEKLNPIFYRLGFNPNGITTLSLITGLLFNYYYYIDKYELSALMLVFSYFFDCMDGNFARTYKMQTKFGDYYDHIKDVVVMLIFAAILFLFKDIPLVYKIIALIVAILITFGVMMHVGCTEKYVKQKKFKNIKESGFLANFKGTCDKLDRIQYVRYFGCGTFNAFIIIFVLAHKFF